MILILINIILSIVAAVCILNSIPKLAPLFISAGLHGKDLCKRNQSKVVPEAQGLICGTVFLISMFIFLGVRFGKNFVLKEDFPHLQFSQYLTALLCICCMLLLGFADDVLNLQWRYKLILPTIASIPLLMVYYVNEGSTTVILPKPIRPLTGTAINIGPLYFIFMSLLSVFCTNAINIYAGINGLESGQTVIVALSVMIFNCLELKGYQYETHLFSLYFMIPFTVSCAALYYYNRYPSSAFVGDTFTYFSGMTFAVVGIVGHFSKTLLLFFIPQIINFLYSVPQLFKIVDCPRHRLPKYNSELDKLQFSEASLNKNDLNPLVFQALRILHKLKLVNLRESTSKGEENIVYLNNLTLINLVLIWCGPTREDILTRNLLLIQIVSSMVAFAVRYPLGSLLYE